MRILGIDPGETGALALYSPERTAASGLRWIVVDIPVIIIESKRTKTGKKIGSRQTKLNVGAFRDWIRRHSPDYAMLEAMQFGAPVKSKDGALVQKGLAGSMRFAALWGAIEATLLCCDVPVHHVQPQAWKRRFNLMKTNKEASRYAALRLFPSESATLARKMDQNRAEAMLIAHYSWERYQERLLAAAE